MKKTYLLIPLLLLCIRVSNIYSQEKMFYGTIETSNALELKKVAPKDIKIISSLNGFSAVKLGNDAAEKLHHMILTHGPGFIYESSEADAIKTIRKLAQRSKTLKKASYSISENQKVNQAIGLVNNTNIANQIVELENYGTRYHTTQKANQSVLDLKQKWETMANGRADVSVKLVNHNSTTMPSLIMTIEGKDIPNEFVILGGHIDSVSPERETNAPGADDNASGIATITEVARVLLEMNFKPQRTIEFMAYAAEEVGLRGSKEIAQDYKSRNINVISYVQFDMTNYKGSPKDVYISDDSYNSSALNSFLAQLMDTYNSSGNHQFTYDYTRCNYGCSDHYSWAQQGYDAAFPFEASFNGSNPYIHTVNDTFNRSVTPNATHAAKFAKLGLEYLIEVAKSEGSVVVPTYCSLKGDNVNDEYIQNVTLGDINNNSGGGNGYQDFTSLSTELNKNNQYTITITPKWTGTVYNEGYAVWIDYNQDADFEDPGEQVWTKNVSKDTPVTGSFTIPANAKLGKTRMRVAMRYNAIPNPCGSFNYGEVEDYSVVISEATTVNICDGIANYDASVNYQTGDKVVYSNTLYERTATGWKNIGNCNSNKRETKTEKKFLVNDKEVILLSPNPVEGNSFKIKVYNELWKYRRVKLYDSKGRLLKEVSMSLEEEIINISDLSTGFYFITLDNTGKKYAQQFVKK
ncbi:M20/M25/M40 family metallo-hydrolase [Tenacibaculum aiptasiae]|uniref:M20/M25/M40 family metallo-hydrolase n=1 Tax=Tenacibaculum aiptasiae TaxID=426481 RepID=A0A7J5AT29_9FLAO|nr:M20/M25/M40 family metallo-hydrolase [Tenacibaculum aiptasiae]KAB1160709.1 M20/M25/M40 family metallo-hydrolase [Tenacibaculum aiptasiae]